MPRVYAFDVDHTLERFDGPVTVQSLLDLRNEGHIIGLCGNWAYFCQVIKDWHQRVSFINLGLPKEVWLAHFREMLPGYEDYVLVGNVMGVSGASDDKGAAARCNWRFIQEKDFAAGVR